MARAVTRVACLFLSTLLMVGCGGGADDMPDVGEVEGTVKLDNAPLAGATVLFQPDGGRPSMGTTDEEGRYELSYTPEVMGAKVGSHSVSISTYQEAQPDAEEGPKKAQDERVPSKYNSETTLKAEVKAGSNTIDFDLDSKGAITNPDEGDDGGSSSGRPPLIGC